MRGHLAGKGHRALLVGWRYIPLWARRIAIRVLYPQFPVGAVAVIRDERGRILLVRQTYHRPEMWGIPGGWVARGETPRQAAARETFEETGLRVAVGRVLGVSSGPYWDVTLAFECRPVAGRAHSASDETDRVAYFPVGKLPPLPPVMRLLLEEAFATQTTWAEQTPPTVDRGVRPKPQ